MKRLWMLILLFLLTGCTGKTVYQIQGVPVPDKVVQAKIFGIGATVTYNLSKSFTVKEDDESYRTHEFLSLFDEGYHEIDESEVLSMDLSVFNPIREHYRIESHAIIEGGEEINIVVYEGNLSRNKITFRLPDVVEKKVVFYYDVYKEDNLVYQSFRAQYIIEG